MKRIHRFVFLARKSVRPQLHKEHYLHYVSNHTMRKDHFLPLNERQLWHSNYCQWNTQIGHLWVYSVPRLAWRMSGCSLKCYWSWGFFITCCCCYKHSNSGNKMKTFSFIGRMTWQFKTGISFPGNYPTRLLPREFYTCKTIYLTPLTDYCGMMGVI